MRYVSAYSRHSDLTAHSAHTRLATSTPTPSEGKNSVGDSVRHRAWSIHAGVWGSGEGSESSTASSTAAGSTGFPVTGAYPSEPDCASVGASTRERPWAGRYRVRNGDERRRTRAAAPGGAREARLPGPGRPPLGGPRGVRRRAAHRRVPPAGDCPAAAPPAPRPAVPA